MGFPGGFGEGWGALLGDASRQSLCALLTATLSTCLSPARRGAGRPVCAAVGAVSSCEWPGRRPEGARPGGGVLPRPRFPAPSAAAAADPEMGPAPGRAHIPTWPPGSPARAPVCAASGGLQCKDAGSPQVRVPCWASCWASRWGRSACFRGGPGCTTDAVPADTSGKLGGAGRTQARATRGLWVRPPPPGGVWLCAPRRLALPPRGPRSRRGLRLAFPPAPRTRSVPLTGARSGDKAVALSGLRGVSDYGVVLPQKARVTGFDSESNSGWKSVTACGKQNQTRLTFLPVLQRVCFVW